MIEGKIFKVFGPELMLPSLPHEMLSVYPPFYFFSAPMSVIKLPLTLTGGRVRPVLWAFENFTLRYYWIIHNEDY